MKTVKLPSGEVIEDRRSNENGWLVRWIIVAFWGLLVVGASAWGTTIHAAIKDIQEVQTARGQEIATLKAENSFILKRLDEVKLTLDSVNTKVTEMYRDFNGKGNLRR